MNLLPRRHRLPLKHRRRHPILASSSLKARLRYLLFQIPAVFSEIPRVLLLAVSYVPVPVDVVYVVAEMLKIH